MGQPKNIACTLESAQISNTERNQIPDSRNPEKAMPILSKVATIEVVELQFGSFWTNFSSQSLAGQALDLKLVMLRVHGCQIVYNSKV